MSRPVVVAPRRPPTAPDVNDAAAEAFIRGAPRVSAEHLAGVSETPAKHPKARAAAGTAVIFERKRGGPKRRMNVYFTPGTFAALEAHCHASGEDLSRFIDAAVAAELARRR